MGLTVEQNSARCSPAGCDLNPGLQERLYTVPEFAPKRQPRPPVTVRLVFAPGASNDR